MCEVQDVAGECVRKPLFNLTKKTWYSMRAKSSESFLTAICRDKKSSGANRGWSMTNFRVRKISVSPSTCRLHPCLTASTYRALSAPARGNNPLRLHFTVKGEALGYDRFRTYYLHKIGGCSSLKSVLSKENITTLQECGKKSSETATSGNVIRDNRNAYVGRNYESWQYPTSTWSFFPSVNGCPEHVPITHYARVGIHHLLQ